MSDVKNCTSVEDFDISSYWLYSDLKDIIILPIDLSNLVKFLNGLDLIRDESNLIKIINNFSGSMYAMPTTQRLKLLNFLLEKLQIILYDENHFRLKSLITLTYCLVMISHRDENRLKSEIEEIKIFSNNLITNILEKIKINSSTKECLVNLHIFIVIFIKQLNIWLRSNDVNDEKLIDLSVSKKIKKHSDLSSKSLLFIYKKFSNDTGFKYKRSIHHLLILSFYSFLPLDKLEEELKMPEISLKRSMETNGDIVKLKLLKLEECNVSIIDFMTDFMSENFTGFIDKLNRGTAEILKKEVINKAELIVFYKMTPEIILQFEQLNKSGEISNDDLDNVSINLLKLWTFGLKNKVMKEFEYNLYFWPLVSKEIKMIDFKRQINATLDFIMEFQSKLIQDILNNPSWLLEILVNIIKCIIHKSTNDKKLNDHERKEIVDLIGEVGKVLEVVLRPKAKSDLYRVVVVIPHKLFFIISELQAPLYPEIKRTINKNIISPIITVLNKHTLNYMKMELKGAAREVCREYLEIK